MARTQAERSAATRRLLIDAAIELLLERGWAATTSVAICERAGVTRGALLHHYENLAALLADALDALYDEMGGAAPPPRSMRALVDATWEVVGTPRFKAVLEAWLAASNDRELALALRPVIERFAKLVDRAPSARSILAAADDRCFYLTAREAMFGLALGRATSGGRALPHEAVVLARLRQEAGRRDRNRKLR